MLSVGVLRRFAGMAYEELKQKQSVMWGTGPYQRITDTLTDIHERIIERLSPSPGRAWLDLACGTGAVAERAASAGAPVVGIDLAPALIETARERAAAHGLDIDYRVGDCEALDVPDASFDVASSCVGVMFAPDHAATASELARVIRPGGRIALAAWTPTGGIGDLFRLMAPFQPAPPPSSPFDWGDEGKVTARLGDAFDLTLERHISPFHTPSGESYWDLFVSSYGPAKTLAERLGERREELHWAWVDFFETNHRTNGEISHPREYLLVTGTRR